MLACLHPDLDCSWPKWPELLEGPWDKIVNLAKGGSGLDLQVPLMMKYIMLNDDVSHIIYQLSSWHRWTTPSGYRQNPCLAKSMHTKRQDSVLKDALHPSLARMEEIENFIFWGKMAEGDSNFIVLSREKSDFCGKMS